MEVALRYKVPVRCLQRLHCHTVDSVWIVYIASTTQTVYTANTIQIAFHCLNSST